MENIRINGKQDMQTKVMTALFALFAEIERDLIPERTREGMAKARAAGKRIGRPRGKTGKCKLDGREAEIRHYLDMGVAKASIARICGCAPHTLAHFIRARMKQL